LTELLSIFELIKNTLYEKEIGHFQKKKLPIAYQNSFFSSKQVKRKFPVHAALHRVLDGALLGVLITVGIMTSIALHSQYLWTKSFTKLEKTRDLNRRILESTSILESYLLKNQISSRYFVPTKVDDLIYVDSPNPQNTVTSVNGRLERKLLDKISSFLIKSGY